MINQTDLRSSSYICRTPFQKTSILPRRFRMVADLVATISLLVAQV